METDAVVPDRIKTLRRIVGASVMAQGDRKLDVLLKDAARMLSTLSAACAMRQFAGLYLGAGNEREGRNEHANSIFTAP